MYGNRQYKFCSVVSEVSFFVGNSVFSKYYNLLIATKLKLSMVNKKEFRYNFD